MIRPAFCIMRSTLLPCYHTTFRPQRQILCGFFAFALIVWRYCAIIDSDFQNHLKKEAENESQNRTFHHRNGAVYRSRHDAYSPAHCHGLQRAQAGAGLLAAILIATGVGFLLRRVAPPQRQDIFSKEGFVIVAMAWLALSLVGALPFYHQRRHSPLYRCAVRNGEWLYHHRCHPAAGCRGS